MTRRLPRWLALVAGWLLPPRGRVPEKPDGGSALLRLLAMGGVIGIHMRSFFPPSATAGASIRKLVEIVYACGFWSVPAFILLSGYHAMAGLETQTVWAGCRKRMGRILPPLLFWGLVYTRIPPGGGWKGMKAAAHAWSLCMPSFHLWYVFMLAGLYLLAPACGWMAKNRRAWVAAVLFLAVVMVNPSFWTSGVFLRPLLISIPYAALFTIGCRFAVCGIGRTAGRVALLSCAAYFGCMIFATDYGLARFPCPVLHYLGVFGVWGGLSVFIAVLHAGRSVPPDAAARLYRISKAVFGTYLVHPLVMGTFAKILPAGCADAVWSRTLLFLAVYAASMVFSACLLKIPFLKRVV